MKPRHSPLAIAAFSISAATPWWCACAVSFMRSGSPTLVGTGTSARLDAQFAFMLCVVPLVVHYIIADVVDLAAVRSVFHRLHAGTFARGLLSGTLSLTLAMCGVALFERTVPSVIILASCACAAALPMCLTASRVRDGECVWCGYDLSHTPATAPCPECGRRFSRAERIATSF